jgi:nitrite reductase/ring-hydroxylating ferredoxin subunit
MSGHDARRSPAATGQLDPLVPLVDRRGFLTVAGAASLAALLTGGCSGGADPVAPTGPGAPGGTTLPAGVTRSGSTLRIDLAAVTALQGTNGYIIVADPATIVVHLGNDDFRAFTARCPHAGCLVGSVTAAGIVCPCHGSTFDRRDGRVLVGPAAQGLRTFPVSLAAATRQLTVTTS